MITFEEARDERAEIDEAVKAYRSDPRFRAFCQSAVSAAMQDHGRIDPNKIERDAHDIALVAAVLVFVRIYHRDAEIKALKAEVDMYKSAYANMINIRPLNQMVLPA